MKFQRSRDPVLHTSGGAFGRSLAPRGPAWLWCCGLETPARPWGQAGRSRPLLPRLSRTGSWCPFRAVHLGRALPWDRFQTAHIRAPATGLSHFVGMAHGERLRVCLARSGRRRGCWTGCRARVRRSASPSGRSPMRAAPGRRWSSAGTGLGGRCNGYVVIAQGSAVCRAPRRISASRWVAR